MSSFIQHYTTLRRAASYVQSVVASMGKFDAKVKFMGNIIIMVTKLQPFESILWGIF